MGRATYKRAYRAKPRRDRRSGFLEVTGYAMRGLGELSPKTARSGRLKSRARDLLYTSRLQSSASPVLDRQPGQKCKWTKYWYYSTERRIPCIFPCYQGNRSSLAARLTLSSRAARRAAIECRSADRAVLNLCGTPRLALPKQPAVSLDGIIDADEAQRGDAAITATPNSRSSASMASITGQCGEGKKIASARGAHTSARGPCRARPSPGCGRSL
jgi:hypothetical protein